MKIYGRFWVKKDGKNYLGIGKMELLKGISRSGSISKSAKMMRMSYKAAWDSIDSLNNLSPKPIVQSATGGRGGGGTRITEEGQLAIEAFEEIEKAKALFCQYFDDTNDLQTLKQKAINLQKKLQA